MSAPRHGSSGSKSTLPTKPGVHYGQPMSGRRAWTRSWDQVTYSSDACRDGKVPAPSAGQPLR